MFDLADVLKGVPNLGTSKKQLEYIKRELIDPDPNNFYSLTGIEELAANIQLCGLQQPILVRPIDGVRYMVVSGHRRRAAIELLAEDEPEKWEEISCLVERDEASPELQQLRLIYANANTRTMTGAELAEQAAQVEKLLYQLKEQGYEFPGIPLAVGACAYAQTQGLGRDSGQGPLHVPGTPRAWSLRSRRTDVDGKPGACPAADYLHNI